MKDRDIKKMLAEGADGVLPDDGVKRDIKHRLAIDEERVEALAGGGQVARRSKKPLIMFAAAFAVIAALLCAVLIPYYLKDDGVTPSIPSVDKFTQIDGADDFYVFGAASVGALLSAQTDGGTAAVKAAKSTLAASSDTSDIEAMLDAYLPLVEGLIGGGEITSAEQTGGDYSTYDYSLVITYPHVDGGYSTYVLYYNRVSGGVKTYGGETEEKYDIEGVLSVDGTDYAVDGKYEYEQEGGETEQTITFTVYSGGLPYITLEQENEQEDGETELAYLYTFYSGGAAVKTVEVEYEQEDGETELQLTVKQGTSKSKFEFTLISDTQMTAKASVNGTKYTITITVTDGKYSYSFK